MLLGRCKEQGEDQSVRFGNNEGPLVSRGGFLCDQTRIEGDGQTIDVNGKRTQIFYHSRQRAMHLIPHSSKDLSRRVFLLPFILIIMQSVLFFTVLVLSSYVVRNDAFYYVTSPRRQQRYSSFLTKANDDNDNNKHIITALSAVMDGGNTNSFGSWGDDDNNNDDGNDNNEDGEEPIDYERYKSALEHNTRRTDVRIFLTQRAIQSFINLLITCRDPHTVRWLEVRKTALAWSYLAKGDKAVCVRRRGSLIRIPFFSFLALQNRYNFSNLEKYHGTGAFNLTEYGTWDAILLDMLQQPPDVVVVSARRRGRGHGGWSKNNPYLEDRFVEFEIDIEPPSLVTRILSVRQQISDEWVTDLETLQTINGQILASYNERQTQMRDEESAFDRNAVYYMNNKIMEESETDARASSPFRKSNFDLLALLATQEALHRVLRSYHDAGEERSVSRDWLRQFYTLRLRRYFDGDGEYHRADDFLQELLMTPPSALELPSSSVTQAQIGLVDPLRIAQDLLKVRADVIEEWRTIMRDAVPSNHMELQKSILAVRMGKTISPPISSDSSSPGAFE